MNDKNLAVYKYQLSPSNAQLALPLGAEILSVGAQGDEICLWVLVDPEQKVNEYRTITVVGTGHPTRGGKHIGRVPMYNDTLQFHVFEEAGHGG